VDLGGDGMQNFLKESRLGCWKSEKNCKNLSNIVPGKITTSRGEKIL